MAKPKAVKFQHRSNGHEHHRRQSSSTDASEPFSPGKDADGSVTKQNGPPPSEYEKKKQTFITRTIWTFVMIGAFFGCLAAGHIYVLAIITAVVIVSFKEVIAIAQVPQKRKALPLTRSLNWYFFAVTMYLTYGESVLYYFQHVLVVDRVLSPLATNHRFISFILYMMGFVSFVGSLKRDNIKAQFGQFAWTHMALFLIVLPAHLMMNNVFEGLIWFFLPASFVIINDIFAYICGITFGKTPLIKLSPKKTVEGFVGAWICTIILGYVLTNFLIQYPYFTCPVQDLGTNAWSGLDCTPNPVFVARPYQLPEWTQIERTVWIKPIQFHIFALASLASLVAPFGGFFASGLKRAFNIKDFGDSIPGHGGMTDRMDCQFVMAFIMYMYYKSLIAVYKTTPGRVMELAMYGLGPEEQMEVIKGLGKHLYNQGVVSASALQCLLDQMAKR